MVTQTQVDNIVDLTKPPRAGNPGFDTRRSVNVMEAQNRALWANDYAVAMIQEICHQATKRGWNRPQLRAKLIEVQATLKATSYDDSDKFAELFVGLKPAVNEIRYNEGRPTITLSVDPSPETFAQFLFMARAQVMAELTRLDQL